LIILIYLLFAGMFAFLIWSKKRMDRGEPLFGWKRRQYLQETEGMPPDWKYPVQSLQALLGLKDIKYGIIEKNKNEYAVVLSTESVNYELLSDAGKFSTLTGYEQLFKVLSFPIQIVIQAVRQDSRKEIERFNKSANEMGESVAHYVEGILNYIREITWEESRIVKRVYYVIPYYYEPSQNAQIRSEDRMYRIMRELSTRAIQVKNLLKRAQIRSSLLGSLEALEVVRRSMNRDRTLAALVDDLEKREMLSQFVTSEEMEKVLEELEIWYGDEKNVQNKTEAI
jgi:hypothetical protein